MNALVLALCLCSGELMLPKHHCKECEEHGDGDMSYKLVNSNDPCYRGTLFSAKQIILAYGGTGTALRPPQEAFAYHHFQDKRLTVSGFLIAIQQRRDVPYVVIDPVTKKPKLEEGSGFPKYVLEPRDVINVVVYLDRRLPLQPAAQAPLFVPPPKKPVTALEFRFPVDLLKNNPKLRCNLAALFPSSFVTLKGDCRGAYPGDDDYTAIVFENAELVSPVQHP